MSGKWQSAVFQVFPNEVERGSIILCPKGKAITRLIDADKMMRERSVDLSQLMLEFMSRNKLIVKHEVGVEPLRRLATSITVDYDMPLNQAFTDGDYNNEITDLRVNLDEFDKYFPAPRQGKQRVVVELMAVDQFYKLFDVLCVDRPRRANNSELQFLNLRHATHHELLAFGAAHPSVQLHFFIRAYGAYLHERFSLALYPALSGDLVKNERYFRFRLPSTGPSPQNHLILVARRLS